jgi:putative two-component system response regulator
LLPSPPLLAGTGRRQGDGGEKGDVIERDSGRQAKPAVLVVDDDPAILELLRLHLTSAFDVVATSDPWQASELARARNFDVHLYDLSMDRLPGLELLLLTLTASPEAAVVLMTGEPTIERAVEALRAGATDLLLKPLRFEALSATLRQAMAKARGRRRDGGMRITAVHDALTRAVEAKDPTTSGHGDRVRHLCRIVGTAIGLCPRDLEILDTAAALHDIGKIGVPDAVLCKPGALTPDEYELIKKHPAVGGRILEPIPGMDDVRRCVVEHHERWDGKGYPNGTGGDDIAVPSRVLILAEVFDALAHARSYKPAWPKPQIEAFFVERAGSHFDPELSTSFLDLVRRDFALLVHPYGGNGVKADGNGNGSGNGSHDGARAARA